MNKKTARQDKPSGSITVSGTQITATSQTTRFHVDTLTTLSKEIDLKQVALAIGKKDLLMDAHLRLKSNVTYGLVGRNGQGKSTIADKIIPGISENLRILLVGQVEDTIPDAQTRAGDSSATVSDDDLSVVQHVVRRDTRREDALWEYKTLSTAAESASVPQAKLALATVDHARELKALRLAQKIASKRSGARGAQARKDLLDAEARVVESQRNLENAKGLHKNDGNAEGDNQDPAAILHMFGRIQNMLEETRALLDYLDADATEANTRSVLLGLGFAPEQLDAKFQTLSGGWRSRCALASALLQKPDLLILDEPTNYLDIPSVLYLQKYLQELTETTILIVAHDREFLDAVTQETIILRGQSLAYHEGSITVYERAALQKRKSKIRQQNALDKKRELVEKSITEGARAAKKSGDENKARMVKSRQKKLDERWGMEKNEKGHRFKTNRDLDSYVTSFRVAIVIEDLDPPVNLPFPDPEPMRFPGPLVSAANVSFRYSLKAPLTLEDATLTIRAGDRVALVGKNGEGKSTLVKLLIGELNASKGVVERHPRLKLGYYSQHSVEELSKPGIISISSLEHFKCQLEALYGFQVDEPTARSFLGAFGLQGQTATNPIGALSGGQKVRLALALIVYPAPDLLVLDEVSTHLDMDTTAGLIRALRSFQGAILLVSHDRHFVKCVVEGGPIIPPSELMEDDDESNDDEEEDDAKVGTVYKVGPKGRVKVLPGGVGDYVAIMEKKLAKLKI